MSEFGDRILLAEGRLNWPKSERQANRYGVVTIQTAGRDPADYEREQIAKLIDRARGSVGKRGSLIKYQDDPTAEYATFTEAPVGEIGRLLVEILVARESYHIGDIERKIKPITPEVGEVIILGEGRLFIELADYSDTFINSVGVRPEDRRDMDWMDPHALYRAHDQTVELAFEPKLA